MQRGLVMQKGFSLLESLVVLTLIGLCLAMTLPVFANMENQYAARSAASTIASDLMTVRYRAIADNRTYRVRFLDGRRYVVERQTGGVWEARRQREFERSVDVRANNSPVFTPTGATTNMATITVASNGTLMRRITLAITGRVKSERID